MKKIIGLFFAGAITLIVAALLFGWFTLKSSLPDLDGEVLANGLAGVATIERDAAGIPVITASDREDLAFATGFAHGQDRFFQMDTIRRQAAGELSELVGAATIELDKRYRFHRFRARAAAVIAAANDADRQLLQRYADGVNAGRDSLRGDPFEYFVLRAEPEPWRVEDSILVVYAMFMQLNDARATRDIRRGLVHAVLPAAVYDWMYPDGTRWDAPLVGEPRTAAPIPAAKIYSLREVIDDAPAADEKAYEQPLPGSNNWAVSGALTRSGRAMVSNDMHLRLSTPNIYYRAHLLVDGDQPREVSGIMLPGAPFVVAGSNTKVAWGYTNSYGDYTDAVILRPGSTAGSYRTADGDRLFEVHAETINVNGAEPVEYSIRETIWGPVIDDIDYPGGDVAVSWIAHHRDAVNLNILNLETAGSAFAALDIANSMGMPPQNFVTGDAAGNIGWTIAGKIPLRSEFNAMLPADWSQVAGWRGWVEEGDYPRVVNPPSGRIWTANARVTDADALRIVGDGGYDIGARARQIRDSLFAKDTFVAGDMLAIQYDDRALFLSPWRDVLLEILTDNAIVTNEQLREYKVLVRDWIPRAAADSVGYRLVRAFRLEVERRVFHALTEPAREAYGDDVRLWKSSQFEAALWSLVNERPMHMLPAGYDDWEQFLLAAVEQNIRHFTENFDGPLTLRTWGEVNTAAIRHPLSRSIPLFGSYLDMPYQVLNGDDNMPKAQAPAFGASERFSVAPGDEANGLLHMPSGQSGHPLSEFYGKGHADWVDGWPSPFLPGEITHTLTLVPNSR